MNHQSKSINRGLIVFNALRSDDDQYSEEDWEQTHPDIVDAHCRAYDQAVWHNLNFGNK